MKMTTTFAAVAMCASLYLTTGPAQALVSLNSLMLNGLHLNGMQYNGLAPKGVASNGGISNGIYLNGMALNDGLTPEVPRASLPFNGLSQKGLGKTHP